MATLRLGETDRSKILPHPELSILTNEIETTTLMKLNTKTRNGQHRGIHGALHFCTVVGRDTLQGLHLAHTTPSLASSPIQKYYRIGVNFCSAPYGARELPPIMVTRHSVGRFVLAKREFAGYHSSSRALEFPGIYCRLVRKMMSRWYFWEACAHVVTVMLLY